MINDCAEDLARKDSNLISLSVRCARFTKETVPGELAAIHWLLEYSIKLPTILKTIDIWNPPLEIILWSD